MLFPMKLSNQWMQALVLPPKQNLVIHFVSQNFRNAFANNFHQEMPKCNSAFFD